HVGHWHALLLLAGCVRCFFRPAAGVRDSPQRPNVWSFLLPEGRTPRRRREQLAIRDHPRPWRNLFDKLDTAGERRWDRRSGLVGAASGDWSRRETAP